MLKIVFVQQEMDLISIAGRKDVAPNVEFTYICDKELLALE